MVRFPVPKKKSESREFLLGWSVKKSAGTEEETKKDCNVDSMSHWDPDQVTSLSRGQ
jgi:hypothetical protein